MTQDEIIEMADCPTCEYHKQRAQLWRDEAYRLAGHPLPERDPVLEEREACAKIADEFGIQEGGEEMTQDEIIEMAKQSNLGFLLGDSWLMHHEIEAFAKLVAEKEREALEAKLLKLKKGIASNSDYIQGRWDLIGEFQDVIRARGQA